ncbi:8283_t:CDS:1, partial [Funneliformis geosporum]
YIEGVGTTVWSNRRSFNVSGISSDHELFCWLYASLVLYVFFGIDFFSCEIFCPFISSLEEDLDS